MSQFFDDLEARHPEAREGALLAALPAHVAHAKANAPGFGRILKDVDSNDIKSRKSLARLPVTRKSDLQGLQKAQPPLGGLNATPLEKLAKLFVSPGPLYDPEGRGADWWRAGRGLFAGGFRTGELVLNTFAYHFTPAGSMLESGALALGCTVIPAGTGQTEMQVAAIRDLRVQGYVGTPSFLKLIVEKADETKSDISSLRKAQVGAEYLPPALGQARAHRGLIAYEAAMADGTVNEGMILEEALILEIVRPGTGDPLPDGEVGEVVITSFNRDYPLIRFGTGDLSAVLPGASPCGRTNVRLKGWMGRADQSTKVRAMFVTPGQVAEVLRRHPEVQRARLVVEGEAGSERMTLNCEVSKHIPGVGEALVANIREVAKLRGEGERAAPGSLPNEGKVIEDKRKYG